MDIATINALFRVIGHTERVKILLSSFTILSSGPPRFKAEIDDNTFTNGTILLIAFQILVDFNPHGKLSISSVSTVSTLIINTAA